MDARSRAAVTMALAEGIRREVEALAAAGCPLVEIEEADAHLIGEDEAERRLFREAHRRLTDGITGAHLSLSIVGAAAASAGIETILDAPYASLAVDLIAGPDNWNLVTRTPGDRGIVVGALGAREAARRAEGGPPLGRALRGFDGRARHRASRDRLGGFLGESHLGGSAPEDAGTRHGGETRRASAGRGALAVRRPSLDQRAARRGRARREADAASLSRAGCARRPDKLRRAHVTTRFWHGFADMHVVKDREIVIASGDGATITDTNGKTYIDATAALWFCNVGYGRKEIADAVAEQMTRLHGYSSFGAYTTDATLRAADRLTALSPMPNSVVFLGIGRLGRHRHRRASSPVATGTSSGSRTRR